MIKKILIVVVLIGVLYAQPLKAEDECCCPRPFRVTTITTWEECLYPQYPSYESIYMISPGSKEVKTEVLRSECTEPPCDDWGQCLYSDIVRCRGISPKPECTSLLSKCYSLECINSINPGGSYGDTDISCRQCTEYVYEDFEDDSACCKPKLARTSEFSITAYEGANRLKKKAEDIAEKSPMIKEMKLNVKGSVSKTVGQECCDPDPCAEPTDYQQKKGAVSLDLSITFNIPGWDWRIQKFWHGIFSINGKLSLGPELKLTPSVTLAIQGTEYSNEEYANCPSCGQVALSISVGLDLKLKGGLTCLVKWKGWKCSWRGCKRQWKEKEIEAWAELGAKTPISLSGIQKLYGCSGRSGKLVIGKLEGYGSVGAKIFGRKVSFSRKVTFYNGYTRSF